jgi:hypothetical protein
LYEQLDAALSAADTLDEWISALDRVYAAEYADELSIKETEALLADKMAPEALT